MIEIDTSISDPAWEDACQDCEAVIEKAVFAVFAHAPVARDMIKRDVQPEISVVLANDDLVHTLNHDYRDKDKPTNILSFAMLDTEHGWEAPQHAGPCTLGDLVLAFETIQSEADEEKKTFESHFLHLVIHGTLHLLGYDHMQDDDAEIMENLEIQILNEFGISNPYIST